MDDKSEMEQLKLRLDAAIAYGDSRNAAFERLRNEVRELLLENARLRALVEGEAAGRKPTS